MVPGLVTELSSSRPRGRRRFVGFGRASSGVSAPSSAGSSTPTWPSCVRREPGRLRRLALRPAGAGRGRRHRATPPGREIFEQCAPPATRRWWPVRTEPSPSSARSGPSASTAPTFSDRRPRPHRLRESPHAGGAVDTIRPRTWPSSSTPMSVKPDAAAQRPGRPAGSSGCRATVWTSTQIAELASCWRAGSRHRVTGTRPRRSPCGVGRPAGRRRAPHLRRPQAHRDALHLHRPRVLLRRRPAGAGDPGPAGRPQQRPRRARALQPAVHHARRDDDLPVQHAPVLAALRQLPAAPRARHPRHGLPAAQRLQLLDLRALGHLHLLELLPRSRAPNAGWFAYTPCYPTYSPG